MNIAKHIITKCGGHAVVAEMAGVHVTRVHRWTYPKSRGGTDGLIPVQHQQVIFTEAQKRGIALSPSDFFDPIPVNRISITVSSMNSADRTDAPVAAQAYAVLAETISLRVARRLRPRRRMIVWQMRQSLHLRIWSATAGKRACTGLAVMCFSIHRHMFPRTIMFGRWAFACLRAAQNCRLAVVHWRRGVEVLRISSFSLSVQPREVCFRDRV